MPTIHKGLSLDDLLLVPKHTDFATRESISIKTELVRGFPLSTAFISSPMECVTGYEMAVTIAKLGGIGFLYRNMPMEKLIGLVQAISEQKLPVGAAISPAPGYRGTVEQLIEAGVSALLIDTAHGFRTDAEAAIRDIKHHWPDIPLIAGSVATFDGAHALIRAGVDALRVGMGPGSICTTRIVSGMGVPQATAIMEAARAAKGTDVLIIADGGMRHPGDAAKALALGASTVMFGSLFAGTDESPSKLVYRRSESVPKRLRRKSNERKTILFKEYWGEGSERAMANGAKIGAKDEFHSHQYVGNAPRIAEGVEGLVPYRGSLAGVIEQLAGGIISGMYYVGARTISELHELAEFYQITAAGRAESMPHDVFVTNAGKSFF